MYRIIYQNVGVVVGLLWGDEGKGRETYYLSQDCNMVIRATGGPNAGHTIVVGEKEYVVHLLPSSILRSDVMSIIAHGVVVDLRILIEEINNMEKDEIHISPANFKISDRAHLIMPWHITLDKIQEGSRKVKIGTTGRGIGPCYSAKAERIGIRVIDLFDSNVLKVKIIQAAKINDLILEANGYPKIDVDQVLSTFLEYGQKIKSFVCDTGFIINQALFNGDKILVEGAQATYLDLDLGTYPDVTSSNTTATGALTGAGIGPVYVSNIYGVIKAHSSRVGNGPFPTELNNEIGDRIREIAHEYGKSTGRPRRCGWPDLVPVKSAIGPNGITSLCVNHLDTIGQFDQIKVCIAYNYKGQIIDYVPVDLENCEPIYVTLEGNFDVVGKKDYSELCQNTKTYIEFIEEQTGVPVQFIGIGPSETEIIVKPLSN